MKEITQISIVNFNDKKIIAVNYKEDNINKTVNYQDQNLVTAAIELEAKIKGKMEEGVIA